MSELIMTNDHQSRLFDDDEKLALAALQDAAGFKLLYQKWLKPIYRYFYFRVGNEKDAEDLTSQVFLKVYEDLPRYRSRGCFSAWLFSIAHARTVDFYRRKRGEISLEYLNNSAHPSDLLAQAVHSDELQQVLNLVQSLPEEDQELIRLRYAADLNYREIGLVLNRKEDAVRKSITRLVTRIQSQLEVNHD